MSHNLFRAIITAALIIALGTSLPATFDCKCPDVHYRRGDKVQFYCGKELRGKQCQLEQFYECSEGGVPMPMKTTTVRGNCSSVGLYCAPPLKKQCNKKDPEYHALVSNGCFGFRHCFPVKFQVDEHMLDFYGPLDVHKLPNYKISGEKDPLKY